MLPISQPETDAELRHRLRWVDWRPTLVAAGLVALVVAAIVVGFESVSSFERPQVLASLIESIYWMAAAFIGSCGTIAALTLTTLSLMEHLETRRMGPRFLVHIRLTVLGAFSTIAVAVTALVLTSLYATIADVFRHLPGRWVDEILGDDEDETEDEQLAEAFERDAARAEAAAERAEAAVERLAADGRAAGDPVGTRPR